MYLGVNQYYREGLELLRRAEGFDSQVRYKRIYPARQKFRPQGSTSVCMSCPHRSKPGCARAKNAGKTLFFLLESALPQPPSDDAIEELLKEHPLTLENTQLAGGGGAQTRTCTKVKRKSLMTLSPTSTGEHPAPDCSLIPIDTDEETFKNLDLMESILNARNTFRMFDIGSGYGRTLTTAQAMIRTLNAGLETDFTALEPDPAYFQYLNEHLDFNSVVCRCLKCALSDHDGTEGFLGTLPETEGTPHFQNRNYFLVRTCTLDSLLREIDYVDLLLMDIRHAESRVVPDSRLLPTKVRKAHVRIHSLESGENVRNRFDELNWINVWDFPPESVVQTRFGPVNFCEGLQTWINPQFF